MADNQRITAEDVRKGGFKTYDNPKYVKDFGHVDDAKERNMSFGDRLDSLFENSNSTLSQAYRKIAYNDADWSQDAIEIGKTLDISPNVLINGGHDVIERAREMSIRKNTLNDMEAFKAEYPEFSNIQYGSEAEAIELLKHAENVRQTRGIWDSIQQGIWSGNDQLLLAKQGRDLAYETDPNKIVEINHEIERLQNNLSQYRTEGSDWIESIAGATAQQGVIMGRQIASAAMIEGTAGAILGAKAGVMAGGAGAIPGAISGFGTGVTLGLASEIQKMSFGQKYLDLIDKKDANGNRIYSNEEAKIRASVFSLPDAAIEMVGLGLAVKAIKAVKPGVSVLTKMIENQSKTAIMKEGVISTAKESFKAGLKSSGSELLEEGLQDINDKVQTNLWGKQGDVHYSLADIGMGSINAMIDAVPAVVGLGVLGGLGGTAHTIHQFRAFHRLSPEQQDMVVQSDINQRGNQVVSALIKESQVNPLAQKNPELFAKTIQATADKQGIGTVYINAHELVDTQQGQEAIQSLINSGIVTREEATKAIEHEAALPVPISQFAQLNTEITEDTVKALEKATFYTEGGMSVASIEQAVKGAKAYQEHFAGEHAKKIEAVKEDIMKEFSDHSDRERTLAEMVVSSDPYHIKQVFNDMYNQMEEAYRETYHDEHKALEYDKEGPKPKWYDDHVAMHHRAPSYKDRRRIAFEYGKKQLSQEYADVMSNSAMETAMNRYNEMEEALQDLEAMDSIKDTLFQIADSDVHVRSNLSDEGYQIYKDLVGELKKGNPAVASQAKEGALVMAMHADVMANIMKKAGYGHFTAKDYMERVQIESNAKEVAGSGYAQPMNRDVDVHMTVPIVDLTSLASSSVLGLNKKELEQHLKGMFKSSVISLDKKGEFGIPNKLNRRHLVWNQNPKKQLLDAFNPSILSLEELVQSSVLVESVANQKQAKNKHKSKVKNYHYFYVPIKLGDDIFTIKIVGEESSSNIQLNPLKIDLYSVMAVKKDGNFQPHKGSISKSPSLSITIQDMLKDVKHYEGNNYIDEEGNPNYYAQKAYHGTGYEFTKFDLGAIGTGSDATLHGWGLYFAKDKTIASRYRKNVSDKLGTNGKLFTVDIPENEDLLHENYSFKSQEEKVKEKIISAINHLSTSEKLNFLEYAKTVVGYSEYSKESLQLDKKVESIHSAIEILERKNFPTLRAIQKKRTVKKIAESIDGYDTFSIEQQETLTNEIKTNLESGNNIDVYIDMLQKKISRLNDTDGNSKYNAMTTLMIEENPKVLLEEGNITGGQLYKGFSKVLGGDKEAALFLNQQGIKGIRYTDLTDGECFVVFDDSAIRIIQEYNQEVRKKPIWEQKLERDSMAWNDVMDRYKDGEIPNKDVRLMSTPLVLQMLGFSAHDIEITPSVLAKVLKGKHADSIDTEVLKDLPRALANPVAIFKNYDGRKQKFIDNEVIVVVDILGKKGTLIQVPFVFDINYNFGKVHKVKSIFERQNIKWYHQQLENKALLYAHIHKNRPSLRQQQAINGPTGTTRSNIAFIIEQHLQKSNEKVLTNEDLDKARATQQDRYYQAEESSKYRGLTTVYPEELGSKRLIQLFDAANFSTFIHESGHLFLEDLRMLATMDGAPKQVVEDWNTIKEWSGWSDTEGANNTEAHEKFATGFEAYVREGKAPTKVLERIFRRFKEWLSALYKSVTLLGGIPPKEVQDVMARMLATEEDINSYITQQGLDSFERTGLYQSFTEEKQVEWQEKLDRIREKAKEKVLTTYMKELANAKLEEFEASIPELEEMLQRQLVEQYPVYQARVRFDAFGLAGLEGTPYHSEQALIDGEVNDGIGSMKEVVAKEIQSKREEVERFTHDYEAVKRIAEEYLLTTEGMQRITGYEAEAIRKDTNKAVAKHFELISALGDIDVNDPSSIERVSSAIEDDKVQKKVRKLQEKDSAQQSEEIKKLQEELQTGISNMRALRGLSLWSTEDMMEKAHDALRTMTIPQATSFKTYQNKSASSARKADIAISKGQMDEAFHHKQQQLYYQAMARAAYDNLREVETLERDLKKKYQSISRPKSPKRIHSSARYFIQHMMYQLNLVNRDGIEPSKGFTIGDVLLLLDPDAEFQDKAETKMTLDPWIMELLEKPKSWKQLTFDQLLDMGQLLKAVYTQGAQQYEGVSILNEQGESISFEDAGAELIIEGSKRLQSNTKDLLTQANQQGFFGRLQDTFSGYMLSLVKVETILRRYDDDKAGVWNRYIYEPINRATVKGKEMLEDATRNLQQVMKVYEKKELFHIRTERMYNIGTVYSMTKEQVLALALNWGTKNNRQRVIETVGLSDQEEAEVLVDKAFSEFLDDKDWDFVEKTWELINSYYAERSAVQERLYGSPMHKEKGVTFTINGRKIRGQYYPIVYDPTVDGAAKDYEVEDIIKSQMSSSAVWGMGMSATKSRVQLVKGKKLLLSFDVIPRAIDEAINHISMREAATDVNRLLNNRALSDYIVRTTGVETLQMLKTWVRDNWQSEISKSSRLDRVLQDLRRNTSMAIMSYRTSTALLNVLNVIPMTKEIGLLNTVRAITEFMGYPLSDRYVSNRKFVMERSIFLRERIHTLDHDLHEGLSIGGKGMTFFPNSDIGRSISETKYMTKEVRDTISRYGYVFITETDLMLSMPLWKFAYEQKVAELLPKGLDQEYIEAEAISAADRQVRRVFGSGDTKDSVELQRKKNSLVALFTPFYTYANTVLNALVEGGYAAVDKQDYMKLFNHILFWVVLQNMSEALLRSTWSGDDDDAESLLKKMLSSVVTGSFVGFPILRDGVSLAMDMAMGKPSMSKGNETVALSLMPKLLELYRNVKSSKKSWIDVMRSTSQVSNRLTGFSDTFTDGFWTLAKWSFSNTEATLRDLITAIAFDKNLRSREEKRK